MRTLQELWRGEIGLGKTFWLWGFLISGLLIEGVFNAAVGALAGLIHSEFLVYIGAANVFVIALFSYVPVWRSAGNYIGRRIWPILARISVVLGVGSQIYDLFSNGAYNDSNAFIVYNYITNS